MKSPLFEILAMSTTDAATTGTAATIVPGSGTATLQLRYSPKRPNIRNLWAMLTTTGFFQPILNSQHDTTRNFRFSVGANSPDYQKPWDLDMFANSNETIVPTIGSGSGAGVIDSACVLVEYEELGGMQGSYIDNDELSRRQSGILTTVEMELTGAAGATGGWSGAAALNAVTALLKAGREYAILGITSDIAVAALSIQGPCTGNYRNGVPGDIRQIEKQHQGFKVASSLSGVPMIPVLNASDAPSTQLAFLQNETNINPNLTLHLALLK